MTIEEFIEARLAEDEAAATRAARFRYDDPSDAPWVRMQLYVDRGVAMTSDAHFARHDPARVLRQVAVIQTIVEEIRRTGDPIHEYRLMPAIAAIWSGHPDYQQEWQV